MGRTIQNKKGKFRQHKKSKKAQKYGWSGPRLLDELIENHEKYGILDVEDYRIRPKIRSGNAYVRPDIVFHHPNGHITIVVTSLGGSPLTRQSNSSKLRKIRKFLEESYEEEEMTFLEAYLSFGELKVEEHLGYL